VELDSSGMGRATFAEISDLPLGTHQGTVRLTSADPLAVDNTRYFTIEVRPPARVLLLADRAADTRLLRLALEPPGVKATPRFSCTTATFDKAAEQPLEEFQAVLLLDPGALTEEVWKQLDEYAAGGGGVGVFLGHNADFGALNGEMPQRLLAGKLLRVSRDVTYLRPRRLDHPALAGLRRYEEEFPWRVCQVYRYWQLGVRGSDAYTIASYANDDPAILERATGRGRLITMTTPVSDAMDVEGRDPWNALLSGEAGYPFVALCDQIVGYLAQDAEERLEILAGETARLRMGSQPATANYVLRTPDGQASGRMGTSDAELAVSMTDQLGNYRLTAGGEGKTLDRGFSVNAAPAVSELARVEPEALLETFPKEQVELADNMDDVEKYVDVGREGRELYPWAIALVAIVWGAEQVLANRFYRQPKVN
jgi:hypothetical protein